MMGTVLALMAHPDDEVLGCGGTLAKFSALGATIHARFLGTGVGSRGEHSAAVRLAEMRAVADMLKLASVDHASFPDQQFDTVAQLDINKRVEAWLRDLAPTVIYTHSAHDLNRDHRIVAEAVKVATRPARYGPCVVYGCEISGSMDGFQPHFYELLGGPCVLMKLDALVLYASELEAAPRPRSPESVMAMLEVRGAEAGVAHAEAFEVARWVR